MAPGQDLGPTQSVPTCANTPEIGYPSCMTTYTPSERIMRLMKKPLDAILDWLWDRLTYLVMNQGR